MFVQFVHSAQYLVLLNPDLAEHDIGHCEQTGAKMYPYDYLTTDVESKVTVVGNHREEMTVYGPIGVNLPSGNQSLPVKLSKPILIKPGFKYEIRNTN